MADEIRITESELAKLPEYSCSVPTGTTIGKRWKYDHNAYNPRKTSEEPEWYIREYVEHPTDPSLVRIKTTKVAFVVPDCWEVD